MPWPGTRERFELSCRSRSSSDDQPERERSVQSKTHDKMTKTSVHELRVFPVGIFFSFFLTVIIAIDTSQFSTFSSRCFDPRSVPGQPNSGRLHCLRHLGIGILLMSPGAFMSLAG